MKDPLVFRMAMVEAVEVVAGRFRGCLVGALMGDCLGAPFEGEPRNSSSVLNSYFRRLNDPSLKGKVWTCLK